MSQSANLPMNFGGIEEEKFSSFEAARVLMLPIAYEGTVSYGVGTAKGAAAIIEASRNMELYDDETDSEPYKIGIHTLSEISPEPTPEGMMTRLYEDTQNLLKSNKFVVSLGGEHSISAPIIRAHAEKFHNISILQIDAHADLRDEYDGTPFSHASIMARCVKDLKIPAVQVGIRSLSADEARSLDFLPHVKTFFAKDIVGKTNWIDEAVNHLTDNVYLTIDIDGLDPSLVPTTGTPEPGGLGWYEVLSLIRKLAEKRRVVGMDLVEYAHVEGGDATAF
ncbi:MAG: agmatinase, partial [Pyrinomonadaceae bacterium]|nr:agmatinase [Pyrinomonadaceae bacterium]